MSTNNHLCLAVLGAGFFMMAAPARTQPVNDQCQDAMPITDETLSVDTTNATTDGAGECPVTRDIWYRYTASCTGNIIVSLCGSDYDTALAVYDADACPPTGPLACNGDFCELASQVTVAVQMGQEYLVRVGGFKDHSGTGTLTIVPCDGPVCGGAEKLKLRCQSKGCGTRIKAIMRNGLGGSEVEFELDGKQRKRRTVNHRGKAVAKFCPVDTGPHQVRVLECELLTEITCK